jgi:DNA/RNA-binding domain of Phe-tRNA-synthetase-like protein
MHFEHSAQIWHDFPELVPGVLFAAGITPDAPVAAAVASYTATARARLVSASEAELPEIQAWRRAFARMGLKPTQYRCAAESLLRRLHKEGSLPRLHPLAGLCNAISAAFAVPVAAFDVSKIAGHIEVRYAAGDEEYLTFAGHTEHPNPHEVIFADQQRRAHARRWTNRQSRLSAITATTSAALIVAEAMHQSAASAMPGLLATLTAEVSAAWAITPVTAVLTASSPRFEAGP